MSTAKLTGAPGSLLMPFLGFQTSDKAHVTKTGLQPEAAMTDTGDNDTSVIRGPATKKAGRLDSYGAVKQTAV